MLFMLPETSGDRKLFQAGNWEISAELIPRAQLPSLIPPDNFVAYMDPAALGPEFTLRTRLSGDRFQPLGMGRDKKLQDFMVDDKVPREWRDRVPLLVTGGRITWVVGYRIAEWAKVPENFPQEGDIMRLSFAQVE